MSLILPNIGRAMVEIAYDNGMVNREQPEMAVVLEMVGRITDHFTPEQIRQVEEELGKLTEDQLREACIGGSPHNDISVLADEMLNVGFEEPEGS